MYAMEYDTKVLRAFVYAEFIRVQVPYAPEIGERLK